MKIIRPALDFVLPERCPSCGIITPAGGDFCSDCWSRLYFPTGPCCTTCDVPLPFLESEGQQCLACMANAPIHDGIKAAVAYGEVSRQVALKLKYGGKIGLAKVIASHLARHLPEQRDGLMVVPVPLHWTRLWSRSFNQSALIAQSLAQRNGLTYVPDMLIRQKRTPLLRGMAAKERRKILGKAFTLNPRWSDDIRGARILLIDDVYTSGATSDACIKVLKKAGADWVQLFCWARVLREHQDKVDDGDWLKA
jgi:ComF family protein